jgi:hypothetical protein
MNQRVEAVNGTADWLETLDGDAPILLIAPHGGRAGAAARATLHPKVNDLETAEITRELARRLGAPALINVGMDRNELDCNRLSQLNARAPWLLEKLAEGIERIVGRHGRATVLLLHGWNIIEPRVDFGLGVRETAGRLRPPAGAHVSASDQFIHGRVAQLAAHLRAAKILPTYGLRYPGAGAQNLLQALTPRHGVSQNAALRRLAAMAAAGVIDALQLEMSVTVRLPGALRKRNLDALAEIFSRTSETAATHPPTVSVIREVGPRPPKRPIDTASTAAPPLRIGIEFYDPTVRLGGMASFDFGPNAAGGRLMILFDRRRVALFTAEGKPQRSADQVSLGPLTLNADAGRGGLNFRGPAVVVDDGAAYLSVERALAESRVDAAVEVSAALELDGAVSSFNDLLASLERILASAYRPGASPDELLRAVPPHAAFGRLRGAVVVDGAARQLDAAARIGVSFTGLGPQKFGTRRMLWACFRDAAGHNACEARALDDGNGRHRVARVLHAGIWSDCEIADFQLATASPYSPPARISATLTTPAGIHTSVNGTAETFMTLSRPGPDGIRIHTSLGFATYHMGEMRGVGMYEYSRRVGEPGRSADSNTAEDD